MSDHTVVVIWSLRSLYFIEFFCVFLLPVFILFCICSVQFSSVQSLSCVRLFATPWITARQASLSITNSASVAAAAAAAKSLQSCLTLCDPISGSPLGSAVPGILQARTLEWAAISFSNAWKWKVKVKSLSRVLLFATPWTAAYQAPLPLGFSRQEYWSRLTLPSPLLLLGPYYFRPLLCHLCMKCSLSSHFLEEISSLSHSIVFLYFFALIT